MSIEKHGGNIYKIEKEYGYTIYEILDYSANINPIGISGKIKSIVRNNIDLLKHYPDPEYKSCCDAIARHHGVPSDYIIPGNGATELIFLYSRVKSPKRSIIVSPTFSEYELALKQTDSEIIHFELKESNSFIPDYDELKIQLNNNIDLLVLCNPNNPTGVLYNRDDLLDLVEYAAKLNIDIMLDESFLEFTEGVKDYTLISQEQNPNLFILRSMTKILAMPGL